MLELVEGPNLEQLVDVGTRDLGLAEKKVCSAKGDLVFIRRPVVGLNVATREWSSTIGKEIAFLIARTGCRELRQK